MNDQIKERPPLQGKVILERALTAAEKERARAPAQRLEEASFERLDELDELVYEDLAHHNEHTARVVAEAMYASLAPRLDRLTVEQGADG